MITTRIDETNRLEEGFRVGFDSAGLRMTPEEFDAIEEGDYDELYRYELIDGVLVVNGIPLESQASPNEFLGGLLYVYKSFHPNGSALDETLPERYTRLPNSRRLADRVIWAGLGRRPNPRLDVPAIAVEFVSAGKRNRKRDYETKRDEYLSVGVIEYWIIDRFQRTLTVYRATEGAPSARIIGENDAFETDLLPGFQLPLDQLLAQADKWND